MVHWTTGSYGWLNEQMYFQHNKPPLASNKVAEETLKIISPIRFQVRQPDGSVWDVEITSMEGGSLPGDLEIWEEMTYGIEWVDELLKPAVTKTNAVLRVGAVNYKLTCVQHAPE